MCRSREKEIILSVEEVKKRSVTSSDNDRYVQKR